MSLGSWYFTGQETSPQPQAVFLTGVLFKQPLTTHGSNVHSSHSPTPVTVLRSLWPLKPDHFPKPSQVSPPSKYLIFFKEYQLSAAPKSLTVVKWCRKQKGEAPRYNVACSKTGRKSEAEEIIKGWALGSHPWIPFSFSRSCYLLPAGCIATCLIVDSTKLLKTEAKWLWDNDKTQMRLLFFLLFHLDVNESSVLYDFVCLLVSF